MFYNTGIELFQSELISYIKKYISAPRTDTPNDFDESTPTAPAAPLLDVDSGICAVTTVVEGATVVACVIVWGATVVLSTMPLTVAVRTVSGTVVGAVKVVPGTVVV